MPPQSSQAESPSFAQAVTDYKAKKYSAALSGFQKASANNPNDVSCHYYMALCYTYLNQRNQASNEFEWVASKSTDPKLKAQAAAGLAQLGKKAPTAAAPQTNSYATSGSNSGFSRGTVRVMEFYTTWCSHCRNFAPIFDQMKNNTKFKSTCTFDRLDAEAGQNKSLAQKYSVTNYPTVVMADSSGKQIDRFTGELNSFIFESKIERAVASVSK